MEKSPIPFWKEENIDPLANDLGEINARGGIDLEDYQNHNAYMDITYPSLGKDEWAKIKETLPEFELVADPQTGQKLRVQRFNWPSDDSIDNTTINVYNLPFSVPIDLAHLTYQHHLLAEALNEPLLVIENPGYGDSDNLTEAQKSGLKQGDFSTVAEQMLGVISGLGAKKINCIGYSMGSDVASAIAANASGHDIEVGNLFIMESPRVEEQQPLKLFKNFGSDTKNLKFTWNNPADPVLREVAELKLSLPKGLFSYGRGLYRGGLEKDLATALKSQPNMKLTLGSAGVSKISTKSANTHLLRNLNASFPERQIRRIIIPGESHSYGDSGKRYANLAHLVISQSTNTHTIPKSDNENTAK